MTHILAIDLGKFKSVACDYDTATHQHTFTTLPTTPAAVHNLVVERSPDRVVIEVGSQAGWVKDLCEALGVQVQIANPNSSGTSYTTLATIVQLFGEEGGFDFLKKMHLNVNQYTKSGSAPIKAAARGETTIGIVFLHDVVTQIVNGFPIKSVAPCEGTGYEIGSASIIKGARNLENAKTFIDWVLSPAAQRLMPQAKAYQVPSNASVEAPPEAPKVSQIKLIDYDFALYGSPAERKRLLAKWDKEVKALPK